MPDWYWDKRTIETETPSIQDGISHLTEYRYRKEGARFIIDIGTEMDLGYNTLATGVVFFQRFYMFHSFKEFPRYVTAACCLFLAGKVEETPKKCKDIIRVAKNSLSEDKFSSFGCDPKEEVMTLEKILLQTIKFDLKIQHPYSYLTKYAKCLKGDKNKLQKMVQMAWTFINDSLCTTLSVEWEPEIIAIAVMYLAGKLSQFKVVDWSARQPHHLRWWDLFVEDLNIKVLEDICHQILDLYSPPKEKQGLTSPNNKQSETKMSLATVSNVTSFTTANNSVSQPTGSIGIFTTNMAAITSTTNSTATIVTPIIMPRNIKMENTSPSNYPLTGNALEAPQAIFPWSVLPPTLMKQSPSTPSPLVPIANLSVPPPNINLINFYIKQENTQSSENDSPSPNFPVKTQLFKSMMEDQAKKSFMDSPNDKSFMDKFNSVCFKDDTAHGPTDLQTMFRNRNRHNDMLKRSDNQNFDTNWDKREIWDWSNRDIWDTRESNWDIREMRNDNRDCRQYPMHNFRRNGPGPMRNSRRFFKN